MSDAALAHVAEQAHVFARLSPAQKNRVLVALTPFSHRPPSLRPGKGSRKLSKWFRAAIWARTLPRGVRPALSRFPGPLSPPTVAPAPTPNPAATRPRPPGPSFTDPMRI